MNGALAGFTRTLPDEVMRGIFSSFLEPDELGCTNPSSAASPLLLSWVCHYWRNLCLSSPELWAGIVLALGASGQPMKQKSDLSLLGLWIERSHPIPLSIKLICTNNSISGQTPMLIPPTADEDQEYYELMDALMNRLLTCHGRLRTLNMTVLDLSVISPILRTLSRPQSTPYLENVTLQTQHLGIFGEIQPYSFESAARLRTLNLSCPLIVPEGTTILQNLTKIDLRYCSSMDGCLSWLDCAPNLEALKVRFFSIEEPQPATDRMCRLTRLKLLEVAAYSADSDPGPFLDFLDLPALEDLYVDMNDFVFASKWHHVLDLLDRSNPKITSLVLLGTPTTDEVLRKCLKLIPQVTYLGLGTVSEETLDALTLRDELDLDSSNKRVPASPLCPTIEVLDIAYDEEYPIEALAKMVHSRFRDSVKHPSNVLYRTFEALAIPHDSDSPLMQHPLVKECLANGLEVLARPLDEDEDM